MERRRWKQTKTKTSIHGNTCSPFINMDTLICTHTITVDVKNAKNSPTPSGREILFLCTLVDIETKAAYNYMYMYMYEQVMDIVILLRHFQISITCTCMWYFTSWIYSLPPFTSVVLATNYHIYPLHVYCLRVLHSSGAYHVCL